MKICLIRENKQPADPRVALSPLQCAQVRSRFPRVELGFEPSPDRCFTDENYLERGIPSMDPKEADILLGIKEVPKEHLIPEKTYFFFSHTIKEQPHNREMMRAIVSNKIDLIDYECLADEKGRLVGFGRWAGIIGAYNGLLTWGKKMKSFDLTPAYRLRSEVLLFKELRKARLTGIKIALTGSGRVAKGAVELLARTGLKQVHPTAFLSENETTVFTVLDTPHLYRRKDGGDWDTVHFYNNHGAYVSIFQPYIAQTDLLINGMYWEDSLPPLFRLSDTARHDFRIKVIADITCDVEGSVPVTWKATPIEDPVIAWDRVKQTRAAPFAENAIDIMAVTNLPAELPRSASEDFGGQLMEHVLPLLVEKPDHPIIRNATITKRGRLTKRFEYLSSYAGLELKP